MLKKAILSSSVIAAVLTVLGGLYTESRLENQKNELSKGFEKFKLELENKNAQLDIARASYNNLETQLNQFEVALSRYLESSRIAAQNPRSKYMLLTARQWFKDLQERMADLVEAADAQGVDRSTVESEVDSFLTPLSKNLRSVERRPHLNPDALRDYEQKWKPAIERAKNKIREARNKLATV